MGVGVWRHGQEVNVWWWGCSSSVDGSRLVERSVQRSGGQDAVKAARGRRTERMRLADGREQATIRFAARARVVCGVPCLSAC